MSNILELAAQYAISVMGDVEQDFYDFTEQGLNDFANAILVDSKTEIDRIDSIATELQVTCDKQSKRIAEVEKALETSKRALQSYQFGNASTELAESIVAHIDEVLTAKGE